MDLLASRGRTPRRGAVLTCPECGGDFYAHPGQVDLRKFCSRACQNKAHENRTERTCPACGIQFTRTEKNPSRFCSRRCYDASRPKRPKSEPPPPRRTGTDKPCESCGEPMYVQPAQRGKRFCSRACQYEAMRLKGPGGRFKRSDGYVIVYYPKHPDAGANRFVLEHRLVMEQKLGRRLLRSEHVHHVNHVKDDNRPENLELMSAADHSRESTAYGVRKRQTMRDRLAEYERRFGPLD